MMNLTLDISNLLYSSTSTSSNLNRTSYTEDSTRMRSRVSTSKDYLIFLKSIPSIIMPYSNSKAGITFHADTSLQSLMDYEPLLEDKQLNLFYHLSKQILKLNELNYYLNDLEPDDVIILNHNSLVNSSRVLEDLDIRLIIKPNQYFSVRGYESLSQLKVLEKYKNQKQQRKLVASLIYQFASQGIRIDYRSNYEKMLITAVKVLESFKYSSEFMRVILMCIDYKSPEINNLCDLRDQLHTCINDRSLCLKDSVKLKYNIIDDNPSSFFYSQEKIIKLGSLNAKLFIDINFSKNWFDLSKSSSNYLSIDTKHSKNSRLQSSKNKSRHAKNKFEESSPQIIQTDRLELKQSEQNPIEPINLMAQKSQVFEDQNSITKRINYPNPKNRQNLSLDSKTIKNSKNQEIIKRTEKEILKPSQRIKVRENKSISNELNKEKKELNRQRKYYEINECGLEDRNEIEYGKLCFGCGDVKADFKLKCSHFYHRKCIKEIFDKGNKVFTCGKCFKPCDRDDIKLE